MIDHGSMKHDGLHKCVELVEGANFVMLNQALVEPLNVYTIFALIDHSPVGRIHSEEWA